MLNPLIKFRHLTGFLETARLKSVAQAASVLGISQPAASKTIQELEETLQVPIFDRGHRSMTLNASGQLFLRYAGASVAALRQGIDSVDQARGLNEATVKVGALPTVSARILPRAVEIYMARHSGSRVRVLTGPTAYLQSQLRLGDVDFVIGRMAEPDSMTGLSFEHLYSERVALVVRPGHSLLTARPLDHPSDHRTFSDFVWNWHAAAANRNGLHRIWTQLHALHRRNLDHFGRRRD